MFTQAKANLHLSRALGALLVTTLGVGCTGEELDPSSAPAQSAVLWDLSMDAGIPPPLDGGTGSPDGGIPLDGGMPGGWPEGATNRCWQGPFTFYFNPTLDPM